MKIVGYGICGPGEASRYMRATLERFAQLCDEVIILVNGPDGADLRPEMDLIEEFGFRYQEDRREWGKLQWKIKQDFLEQHVAKIAKEGDMMICLDMDEVLDKRLTRAWILEAPLDAYYVRVINLWNDPGHHKAKLAFWNVRMWRWNGNTQFKQSALHCGLAPIWCYQYNKYAPFLLLHYGLMDPADRQRKIERYQKYDPDAKNLSLDKHYYRSLAEDTAEVFDEEDMHAKIADEVATYQQPKPRDQQRFMPKKNEKYHYVRNAAGQTIDVPDRHLAETLKRPGFTYVCECDDIAKEMEDLFADTEVPEEEAQTGRTVDAREGSYQRSQADEAAEVAALNAKDDPAPPAADQAPETTEIEGRAGDECDLPDGKKGVLGIQDGSDKLICIPVETSVTGKSRTGIRQQTTGNGNKNNESKS